MLIDTEKDMQCTVCTRHLEIEYGCNLNKIEVVLIIEIAVNLYIDITTFSVPGMSDQSIMEKCMYHNVAVISCAHSA